MFVLNGAVEVGVGPDIKGTFFVFGVIGGWRAVSVFGSVEAACGTVDRWTGEISCNVMDCFEEERVACDEPGIQIEREKLCIVVEPVTDIVSILMSCRIMVMCKPTSSRNAADSSPW